MLLELRLRNDRATTQPWRLPVGRQPLTSLARDRRAASRSYGNATLSIDVRTGFAFVETALEAQRAVSELNAWQLGARARPCERKTSGPALADGDGDSRQRRSERWW